MTRSLRTGANGEWAALTAGRRRNNALRYRTVELNAVGWTALLLPGMIVGVVVGVVVGPQSYSIVTGALFGGAAAWIVGLVLDRLRDRRSFTNYGVCDLAAAVAVLTASGIEIADTGRWASHSTRDIEEAPYVTVQNKYRRRVEQLLHPGIR